MTAIRDLFEDAQNGESRGEALVKLLKQCLSKEKDSPMIIYDDDHYDTMTFGVLFEGFLLDFSVAVIRFLCDKSIQQDINSCAVPKSFSAVRKAVEEKYKDLSDFTSKELSEIFYLAEKDSSLQYKIFQELLIRDDVESYICIPGKIYQFCIISHYDIVKEISISPDYIKDSEIRLMLAKFSRRG